MAAEKNDTEQDSKPAANVTGNKGSKGQDEEGAGSKAAPNEAIPLQPEAIGAEDSKEQDKVAAGLKATATAAIPLRIEAKGQNHTNLWLRCHPQTHKHLVATPMQWDIDRKTVHVMRVLAQSKGWNESKLKTNIKDPSIWMNFIHNIFTKPLTQMQPMNEKGYKKTVHFFVRLAKPPPTALIHVLPLMDGHTDGYLLDPAFLANTVCFSTHNALGCPWNQVPAEEADIDTVTLGSTGSSTVQCCVPPHNWIQPANVQGPPPPGPQQQMPARARPQPIQMNVSHIRACMDAPVAHSRDSDTMQQKNTKRVGVCKTVLSLCNRSVREAQPGSQIMSL